MPTRLNILSFNIHKGFGLGGWKFTLEHIRNAIRNVDADIVFLQEVLGKHDRFERKIDQWPSASQFEYLADEIWPHFAYGRNAIYTEGHHGNAILSKFPIAEWDNLDISVSPYARRGLLHAALNVPESENLLHAICIHLDLLKSERMIQADKIIERIQEFVPQSCPLLLAGDFNDWGQSVSKKLQEQTDLKEVFRDKHGKHAKTFPSRIPTLRLDRIYYRHLNLVTAKRYSGRDWKQLSDHIPLFACFEL